MTTINAELAAATSRRSAVVSPGTLGIAAATGLVLFEAVEALLASHGLRPTLGRRLGPARRAGLRRAGRWPPWSASGSGRPSAVRSSPVATCRTPRYFLLYILAIAPFMTLLSVGSAVILRGHASWLQATWTAHWPRWTVVVATLLAMDLCNWLAHWGDHRIGALWRIHALHHSQEELSVLTSFRAHPLMHTNGFLLATVPVLLLTGAHPLAPVLITVYVCLGTLPHTNVRWTYGPLGRVFVSPGYHRLHHAVEGRQDVNLGVVLTVWDVLARKARFPTKDAMPCATGLTDRPVVVEQGEYEARRPAPARLMVRQLVQPFRAA